jgi:putative radical SAM enzyme (TIGR03279 family)
VSGVSGTEAQQGESPSRDAADESARSVGPASHGSQGGLVAAVDQDSAAQRAGIVVGERVLEVDGEALRDVIDWRWLADGPAVELTVADAGGVRRKVSLEREAGDGWGIEFAEVVFDSVRTCRNRCTFCFVEQLPKGLRQALYVRDDDFRLSFLQGNFITLTNLEDADVDRIGEQQLTPLYVSLHAVDPAVRERLVCAREDRALQRFDELLDVGVDVHVQIVLVPDVNDGAVLDETLRWLAERDGVLSVGIVPLGYTRHQERFDRSFGRAPDAGRVVSQVAQWQRAFRERDGVTWVYLADEFYLNAGLEVPPASEYDGFPQYENGIGLVRTFQDEFASLEAELVIAANAVRGSGTSGVAPGGPCVGALTGTLFAPVLQRCLSAAGVADAVEVLPVANRFFGGNVSVAGLLTAADIADALSAVPPGIPVLVPDCILNADGLTLDGVLGSELGRFSSADVRLVSCDAGGLLSGLREVAETPPKGR